MLGALGPDIAITSAGMDIYIIIDVSRKITVSAENR